MNQNPNQTQNKSPNANQTNSSFKNKDWTKDPKLKEMDEKKLKYLADLAEKVEHTPKDKLMPMLLSLAAGNGKLNFNDNETDLIVSILTTGMSAEQKKQIETLRTLSKKFASKNR